MRNLNHLAAHRLVEKEIELYGVRGDEHNGVFKVFVDGKSYYVIASNGCGWEHISVSPRNSKNGCPSWATMCAIKDMFFEKNETVIEYHPAEADYINFHENCLHLWRPTEVEIPKPPLFMV